jgi:ribosome assembly protein YihI (activator of Der GTPase)
MAKRKRTKRHKGYKTGKRARQKNLRHPRERFLVSNEALPSWRPIEIFPAGV